ncbi:MAG: hypothetical protein JK586_15580, partial [Nocardiopsis sp. BM-2018]
MSTEPTTGAAPDGPGSPGPGQPGGPELLPTATARRTWAVLGDGIRAAPWAAALAL